MVQAKKPKKAGRKGQSGSQIYPCLPSYFKHHGVMGTLERVMNDIFRREDLAGRYVLRSLLEGNPGQDEPLRNLSKEIQDLFHFRGDLIQRGEDVDSVDNQALLRALPPTPWPQIAQGRLTQQLDKLFQIAGIAPQPDLNAQDVPDVSYVKILSAFIEIAAKKGKMDEKKALEAATEVDKILRRLRQDDRLGDSNNPAIQSDAQNPIATIVKGQFPIIYYDAKSLQYKADPAVIQALFNASPVDIAQLLQMDDGHLPEHVIAKFKVAYLIFLSNPTREEAEKLARAITQILKSLPVEHSRSRFGLREGCTVVLIQVSEEAAELFTHINVQELGIGGLIEFRVGIADPSTMASDPVVDLHDELALAGALRTAVDRFRVVQPFVWLRNILSWQAASTSSEHSIVRSDRFAYGKLGGPSRTQRGLGANLLAAVVIWPILSGLITILLTGSLLLDFPNLPIATGALTGVLLALAGAQVCGVTVSPLAVGGGTFTMSIAFGIAHSFAAMVRIPGGESPFSLPTVRSDLFTTVTGGAVGVSAPYWIGQVPPVVIVLLVAGIAASITVAGWLMGQPQRIEPMLIPEASSKFGKWSRRQPFAAAIIAATLAGLCIPAVMLLSQALKPIMVARHIAPGWSFAIVFACVGGLAMGVSTWLKTSSILKSIGFGLLHAGLAVGLCCAVIYLPPGLGQFTSIAAASAYYHATWFTLAFMIGIRFGSTKAAFYATFLEGTLGFTIFTLVRLFHG